MRRADPQGPRYFLFAQINTEAIKGNCAILKNLIGPGCKLCVAVKCDAYGHGVSLVVPALAEAGVEMMAIASMAEGEELRNIGWRGPVLMFGSELSVYSGKQKQDYAQWSVENDIRLTVADGEDLEVLAQAARGQKRKAKVHLLLDTGMGRMGLDERGIAELLELAKRMEGLEIDGLYTHFSSADDEDKSYANQQLTRLTTFTQRMRGLGVNLGTVHAANSAAIIDLPGSHLDMVRAGISVYGYHAGRGMRHRPPLIPAMKVLSYLTHVKPVGKGQSVGYGNTWRATEDTTVGIVPIGYGDGYDRSLSNRASMTVLDQSVPVIGRVSMDQTIVDLGGLVKKDITAQAGEEVVVIDDNPDAVNSVEKIAELLDTIPYEVVTGLGRRVVRKELGKLR
jgi:alanine racemase